MFHKLKKLWVGMMFVGLILAGIGSSIQAEEAGQEMYRLYNPNSGEHFYTADADEKGNLVRVGWRYEGIGRSSLHAGRIRERHACQKRLAL